MASFFGYGRKTGGGTAEAGGLPLPPPHLRMNHAAEREDEVYCKHARVLVQAVAAMLEVDALSKFKRGFGDLREAEILDLGCGTARFLHGLALCEMTPRKFVGVDVQARQIRWCRDNLSGRGNFHFQHIDVQNDRYNPSGRKAIHGQIDQRHHNADFIMIRSVFTHMRSMEALRTLEEVRKVIAEDGRVYLTVNVSHNAVLWTDRPDGQADGENLLKVQFNKTYFENMIEEAAFRICGFAESIENQCVYFLRPG